MSDTALLPVTRANVFKVADDHMLTFGKKPTITVIKHLFDAPHSIAIAVYLREWRWENATAIGRVTSSPAYLKALNEKLTNELAELSSQFVSLRKSHNQLLEWLVENYTEVYDEWAKPRGEDC
jgi:hypothetical protein